MAWNSKCYIYMAKQKTKTWNALENEALSSPYHVSITKPSGSAGTCAWPKSVFCHRPGHLCDAKVETSSQELVHQNFVVTVVTPNNTSSCRNTSTRTSRVASEVSDFLGFPSPPGLQLPHFIHGASASYKNKRQEETRGDARIAL